MDFDYLKTYGVNGGVFATITLGGVETALSVVLLTVTIVWTVVKLIVLFSDKNKKKDD
jgi:hypothetical protein